MILDIDNLRKDHKVAPYYHGLGMIRLIMPDCTLNFHGKLIPPEAHYIHSHRRNFTSTCLFGEVKNIYYNYQISEAETEYVLEEIDCEAGEDQRLVHKNINLIYDEISQLNIVDLLKLIVMISPFDTNIKQLFLETKSNTELYESVLSTLKIELASNRQNISIN